MFSKLKQLLSDNQEGLNEIKAIETKVSSLNEEITTLDGKLNEAITKRDKYKGFTKTIKNKLNFEDGEELNEDNIANKLSHIKENVKKTSTEREQILQNDIDNLTSQIQSLTNEKENITNQFKSESLQTKIDLEVLKNVGEIHAVNGKASEIIAQELKAGAIIENGVVVYKNEDGTPVRQNGTLISVKDKLELIKSSEDFSFLFSSQAAGGSGLHTGSSSSSNSSGLSEFAQRKLAIAKKAGISL